MSKMVFDLELSRHIRDLHFPSSFCRYFSFRFKWHHELQTLFQQLVIAIFYGFRFYLSNLFYVYR